MPRSGESAGEGDKAVFEKGALEEVAEDGGVFAEGLEGYRFPAGLRIGRGDASAHQGAHRMDAAALGFIEKGARGVQQRPLIIVQSDNAAVEIFKAQGHPGQIFLIQTLPKIRDDRLRLGRENSHIDYAAETASRPFQNGFLSAAFSSTDDVHGWCWPRCNRN